MAALDTTLADPCSLLNVKVFPNLWISTALATDGSSDGTILPLIANQGVPVTYITLLSSSVGSAAGSASILADAQTSSSSPLVQFLSGGGVTSVKNGGLIDYSKMQNVVLSLGDSKDRNSYVGIVDTFIIGTMGKRYTYSTADAPIMNQPQDFWNPQDSTVDGSIISNPSSLLGMILGAGFMIQQVELFKPSEFDPTLPPPPSGTESLVYLYQLSQTPNKQLTPAQKSRVITLEAKNLRFFGAFYAEYCFYRTRYEYLLQEYFVIYSKQSTTGTSSYSPPASGSPVFGLFAGQGPADNQYSAIPLSQADYLKGLTYHMAILNTRMTDLRILLGYVNNYYAGVMKQIQIVINDKNLPGSNTDLTNKIIALQDSSKAAATYMSERDFHRGVLEYNSEKNRYSNILLGLYAFLNIVAVSMIVKLSRS
jgi:hypothetical protein